MLTGTAALHRHRQNSFGFVDRPGSRKCMNERCRDLRIRCSTSLRAIERGSQQRHGIGRSVQRDVQQMPQVMSVPRVGRRGSKRARVGVGGVAKITEQRLAERESRPSTFVLGEDREHLPRMKGCLPRLSLHQKLGQLTMREPALFRTGLRSARKPMKKRQDLARCERAFERPLHVLAKPLRFGFLRFAPLHSLDLGCSVRQLSAQTKVDEVTNQLAQCKSLFRLAERDHALLCELEEDAKRVEWAHTAHVQNQLERRNAIHMRQQKSGPMIDR